MRSAGIDSVVITAIKRQGRDAGEGKTGQARAESGPARHPPLMAGGGFCGWSALLRIRRHPAGGSKAGESPAFVTRLLEAELGEVEGERDPWPPYRMAEGGAGTSPRCWRAEKRGGGRSRGAGAGGKPGSGRRPRRRPRRSRRSFGGNRRPPATSLSGRSRCRRGEITPPPRTFTSTIPRPKRWMWRGCCAIPSITLGRGRRS